MMRTIAKILGTVLCLTGLIGFVSHEFMDMVLNPLHNLFLIAVGAIALYFGTKKTEREARNVNRVLGVMFTLLGIFTLLSGPGSSTVSGIDVSADHFLKLIPGHLEYSTADGVRDLLTGLVGMLAFIPRQVDMEDSVVSTREKVSGRH